jgi:rRNA pseudouridine-1189 N-methylase Emg1 (Nep1/Mra1 family)
VQANGEVRTTFKRKLNKIYPNNSRSLYFYVTASGQRIPIKMAEDPLLKESEVAIFSGGYSHGETGSEITESDFLIFTKQEADAYYHKR